MVISPDGTTFDNSGEEHQNLQILDIIQASTFEAAEDIASKNNYGDFPNWQIVEYLKPPKIIEHKHEQNHLEEEL